MIIVSRADMKTLSRADVRILSLIASAVESDTVKLTADESSNLLRMRESVSLLRLAALPASMPNDCAAATSTNRVGTHILAIKRFIQEGKGTNIFYILKTLISWASLSMMLIFRL